jgi:hypothetical protein
LPVANATSTIDLIAHAAYRREGRNVVVIFVIAPSRQYAEISLVSGPQSDLASIRVAGRSQEMSASGNFAAGDFWRFGRASSWRTLNPASGAALIALRRVAL